MKINKKNYILVTGCAGFIGFHFTRFILRKGFNVIGVDSLNSYYDLELKNKRLSLLKHKKFKFYKIDIQNKAKLNIIFKSFKIENIVNLAAQAGVRDAIKKPRKYLNYNIIGFLNIIELSKEYNIKHLVYASTSSVYGLNKKIPFKESDKTEKQAQFYAVTKKTNELMAHVWSSLYKIPTTGLRFFTVYGPWGRPDMALYKFTKNISENKKIPLHNHGKHLRDFTYIDDIVSGIYLSLINKPRGDIPAAIYNLGNNNEVSLKYFVSLIEKYLKKKSIIDNLPLQKGDIYRTKGDINLAKKKLGYRPTTSIDVGVKKFVNWYLDYHQNK